MSWKGTTNSQRWLLADKAGGSPITRLLSPWVSDMLISRRASVYPLRMKIWIRQFLIWMILLLKSSHTLQFSDFIWFFWWFFVVSLSVTLWSLSINLICFTQTRENKAKVFLSSKEFRLIVSMVTHAKSTFSRSDPGHLAINLIHRNATTAAALLTFQTLKTKMTDTWRLIAVKSCFCNMHITVCSLGCIMCKTLLFHCKVQWDVVTVIFAAHRVYFSVRVTDALERSKTFRSWCTKSYKSYFNFYLKNVLTKMLWVTEQRKKH